MSNTQRKIYDEAEFNKLTQQERNKVIADLQAEIDDIIAQKNILQEKQRLLERLHSMYEYDYS